MWRPPSKILTGLVLLGLAWLTPCAADPDSEPAPEPTPLSLATLEEQTLDRSGEVNPGDSPQIPSDLHANYTPFLGDTLWLKAGGYLQLEASGDFGATGRQFTLTPSQLGTEVGQDTSGFIPLGMDARLNFRRTRLHLDAYSTFPEIRHGSRAYAEIDFSGKNGSVNLRHLFLSLPYVLIGRTNSAFKDPAAEPESIDSGGPNAKMGLRQQGIRAVIPIGGDTLSLALEDPGPGISPDGSDLSDDGLKRKLDWAGHYRSNTDWGHLQFSAIRRDLSLINSLSATDPVNKFTGWGVGLSGQAFVDDKDNFQFEFSAGPGLGRYLNDLAGTRSELGVTADGQVHPQFAWGGFVAYQHWLDEETRLNTYLSTTQVNLLSGQAADSFQRGYKVSLNVMRDVTENLRLGLEYEHGFRVSRDGFTAAGGRLEFMIRCGL